MRKIILSFGFVLLTFALSAQQLYQRSYGGDFGDYGVSIISNGSYNFVFGYTDSLGTSDYDFAFIKADSAGNIVFSKRYGGFGADVLYSAIQTSDGGFAMVGNTQSFGAGMTDIYLIKVDSVGNYEWSKTYGGIYQDFGYDLKQTVDSGFIICGERQSPNVDAVLIKTNSIGDTIWTKRYGGILNDNAQSIAVTYDNKYVFTGLTRSFGEGSEDIYVVKVDTNGSLIWTKTIGTTARDEGHSIIEAPDKSLIIAGRTEGFGLELGFPDCFLISFDSLGFFNWAKVYGNDSIADWGQKVNSTTSGFIITGMTATSYLGSWNALAIKTNNVGDTLWTKKFGSNYHVFGSGISETSDGNFIMVGFAESFPANSASIYSVQMDSAGNTNCFSSSVGFQVINPTFAFDSGGNIQTGLPFLVTTPFTNFSNTNFTDSLICQTITGIMPTTPNNTFNVFPNPSSGQLTILSSIDITEIKVINLLGQTIYSTTPQTKTFSFRLNTKGIYFVVCSSGKQVTTKKIIVAE